MTLSGQVLHSASDKTRGKQAAEELQEGTLCIFLPMQSRLYALCMQEMGKHAEGTMSYENWKKRSEKIIEERKIMLHWLQEAFNQEYQYSDYLIIPDTAWQACKGTNPIPEKFILARSATIKATKPALFPFRRGKRNEASDQGGDGWVICDTENVPLKKPFPSYVKGDTFGGELGMALSGFFYQDANRDPGEISNSWIKQIRKLNKKLLKYRY